LTRPVRVLIVHTYYTERGGEDAVFEAEAALLERQGHEVIRYAARNHQFALRNRLEAAVKTVWNWSTYREIRRLIEHSRPDIMHVHNTFPGISPSVYYAADAEHLPIVQSLHNYRLICPNGLLFRDGHVCEDCVGRTFPWPGVVHSCHHRGRGVSAVSAMTIGLHRMLKTWDDLIDTYIIVGTPFGVDRYERGGLSTNKMIIKPNFLDPDPGFQPGGGGYALFVGRLVPEKGIGTLLEAWKEMPGDYPLKIVGDGPMRESVQAAAETTGVEWVGRQPMEATLEIMGDAEVLIFPSEWYEGMPRTIIESLAVGTPVIVSNIGGIAGMVQPASFDSTFVPGDPASLRDTVERFFVDRESRVTHRENARRIFLERYTAEQNYRELVTIYEETIARRSHSSDG
jgi:glycosyltransferase involved in cell wall biosynthesis